MWRTLVALYIVAMTVLGIGGAIVGAQSGFNRWLCAGIGVVVGAAFAAYIQHAAKPKEITSIKS